MKACGAQIADEAAPAQIRSSLFRKYLISFVAVVSAALIANSLFDAFMSYREQKNLLVAVQREQAEAAAAKINQFIREIEHRGSTGRRRCRRPRFPQRIFASRRSARQRLTPAVAEIAQLDANGHEQLRVSRDVRDVVGSQRRLFEVAGIPRGQGQRRLLRADLLLPWRSSPYMTLAVSGRDRSVTLADVNLRFMWDRPADQGREQRQRPSWSTTQGRLIAHPDLRLVLQNTDMSRLPQVAAALNAAADGDRRVVEDLAGRTVLRSMRRSFRRDGRCSSNSRSARPMPRSMPRRRTPRCCLRLRWCARFWRPGC